MPKSKNRRKKRKKKSSTASRASGAGQAKKQAEIVYKHRKLKKTKTKTNLLVSLYANEAEGMYQLVSVAPFFFGAWLIGGFSLNELDIFFVASVSLIFAVYTPSIGKSEIPYRNELFALLYVAQFLLPLWFYSLTKSVPGLFLLVSACGLTALGGLLKIDSPRAVILRITQSVFSMSLLALLGIYTQSYSVEAGLNPLYAVFGFVPACLLASAYVAKYSFLFEKASWKRNKEKINKDGEILIRPAGLARLYSLLFIAGPGIPVAIAPLGILPHSFLICALGFWKAPDLLDGYLKKTMSDVEVGIKTITLAALMALLVFIAGLFSGV